MTYQSIVISSGHSTKCQGAIGLINEVEEATFVAELLATDLRLRGVNVTTYHDTVSTTQDENLNRIVDFHNSKLRELDISVHFNASVPTANPVGTEVWHYKQPQLAAQLSAAIAKSGLKDRGAKQSSSLFFLSHTAMPSVLLEIAFVDSEADVAIYRQHAADIARDMADVLGGSEGVIEPPEPEPSEVLFSAQGTCSWFGGPDDTTGVSATEGLAFIYSVDEAPHLFLPEDDSNKDLGLARRLNPQTAYLACRWDYSVTPKEMLRDSGQRALVTANGISIKAWPADWGPHEEQTGRAADLSPFLMECLQVKTDDIVSVIYPCPDE